MTLRHRIAMAVHCPSCGAKLEELYIAELYTADAVEADAAADALRGEPIPLEAVRHCYGQCDQCDTWLELVRRPGAAGTQLSDFTLTWDPDRERLVSRRRFFTRLFQR